MLEAAGVPGVTTWPESQPAEGVNTAGFGAGWLHAPARSAKRSPTTPSSLTGPEIQILSFCLFSDRPQTHTKCPQTVLRFGFRG